MELAVPMRKILAVMTIANENIEPDDFARIRKIIEDFTETSVSDENILEDFKTAIVDPDAVFAELQNLSSSLSELEKETMIRAAALLALEDDNFQEWKKVMLVKSAEALGFTMQRFAEILSDMEFE
ncbi:MAG: hypothetical protein AB1656_02980 [Candidatus Omnitrophota bacterium]